MSPIDDQLELQKQRQAFDIASNRIEHSRRNVEALTRLLFGLYEKGHSDTTLLPLVKAGLEFNIPIMNEVTKL